MLNTLFAFVKITIFFEIAFVSQDIYIKESHYISAIAIDGY